VLTLSTKYGLIVSHLAMKKCVKLKYRYSSRAESNWFICFSRVEVGTKKPSASLACSPRCSTNYHQRSFKADRKQRHWQTNDSRLFLAQST